MCLCVCACVFMCLCEYCLHKSVHKIQFHVIKNRHMMNSAAAVHKEVMEWFGECIVCLNEKRKKGYVLNIL